MYLYRNRGKIPGVYCASSYLYKRDGVTGLKPNSYFLTQSACQNLKAKFLSKKRIVLSEANDCPCSSDLESLESPHPYRNQSLSMSSIRREPRVSERDCSPHSSSNLDQDISIAVTVTGQEPPSIPMFSNLRQAHVPVVDTSPPLASHVVEVHHLNDSKKTEPIGYKNLEQYYGFYSSRSIVDQMMTQCQWPENGQFLSDPAFNSPAYHHEDWAPVCCCQHAHHQPELAPVQHYYPHAYTSYFWGPVRHH
jgi:hypothetical protein